MMLTHTKPAPGSNRSFFMLDFDRMTLDFQHFGLILGRFTVLKLSKTLLKSSCKVVLPPETGLN